MMRLTRHLPWAGFGLLALLIVAMQPANGFADDVDRVRELRSTASIMPLSQILKRVEKRFPGTLLEVELEEEKGQVIYEMELLGHDRVVRKLKVNAKNGDIIAVEKK